MKWHKPQTHETTQVQGLEEAEEKSDAFSLTSKSLLIPESESTMTELAIPPTSQLCKPVILGFTQKNGMDKGLFTGARRTQKQLHQKAHSKPG